MILDLRILNELRDYFLEVRILQGLADIELWAVSGMQREIVAYRMRHTRVSIAREYRLAK